MDSLSYYFMDLLLLFEDISFYLFYIVSYCFFGVPSGISIGRFGEQQLHVQFMLNVQNFVFGASVLSFHLSWGETEQS